MRIHPLFVALFTAAAIHAAPSSFAARTELPYGNVITTGDYNGDGLQDLIAAVAETNGDFEVTIQISGGNGTFTQGPMFDLGPGFTPVAIATADFNGDGKLDIAIAGLNSNGSSSTVYVAIQHSGSFLINPLELPESIQGTANIAIGDLNGDKRPDIVIPTNAGIAFFLNAGGGKFEMPELASTTGTSFVTIADVNGDKHQDLVALPDQCCYGNSVNIILGDGHGGFYEPTTEPGFQATKIAVADLNGDGKLDIVGANSYGVQFELGNGDGTFGTLQTVVLPSPYTYGTALAVGNLNGDGAPDLAVVAVNQSSGYADALIILPNTGKGSFGAGTAYSIAENTNGVILADFTTAKLLDVLLVPTSPGLDAVLFNFGKAVFGDGFTFATPESPAFLVSGDFNNDGLIDLAGVSQSGLTVYLNAGGNSVLSAQAPLPFFTGPLVAGDFNGDGRLDIADVNSQSVDILLGVGGGNFFLKPTSVNLGGYAYAIAAADLNNDGKLDLVTNNATVVLGNGNGAFQAPLLDESASCYSNYPENAVFVEDFNRDGKPDLVTLCGGNVAVYLNNGAGVFGSPSFSVYNNALGLAVGDFNHDGIPDFAYVVSFYAPNTTASDVYIAFGNGGGGFTSGPAIQVPGDVSQLVAADFNGDGKLDIAGLDQYDAAVVLLAGKGDGTFQNPLEFGTASNPVCLLAVPLHDPVRPQFPDLVSCASLGISINYNRTK